MACRIQSGNIKGSYEISQEIRLKTEINAINVFYIKMSTRLYTVTKNINTQAFI